GRGMAAMVVDCAACDGEVRLKADTTQPMKDHSSDETTLSIADWKNWAVILGPALFFGLIEAAQLRLGSAVLGRPMPFPLAVVRVVPYWVLLAALLPLAMAAARRFRLSRYVLWPTLPALAASAIAFALLTLAG